jgi:SAM-dependent methyltransferase
MSRDAAYFDALYADNPDPWGFATSPYERAKYDATLAAMPPGRFRSALEIGCSIGVFTRRLAERCDRLLAVDLSAAALARARATCDGLTNVTIEQRAVPAEWPEGSFDLILVSEVLYFLDAADVARTATRAAASLKPGGCLVTVNWLGETGTELSGDAAAALFLAALPSRFTVTTRWQPDDRSAGDRSPGDRSPGYRLDRLRA